MKHIVLTIGDCNYEIDVNAEDMSWQIYAEFISAWAKAMALDSMAPKEKDE